MFRSIRWRLVLSYVLLTLLTVGLVGVLALSLMQRYVEQQEIAYLTANAEAVAQQAVQAMRPMVRRAELRELARTAAFLGNARVQILDARRRVLADSGPTAGVERLVWILSPPLCQVQVSGKTVSPSFVERPSSLYLAVAGEEGGPYLVARDLSGTSYTVVHRWEGMWGARFVFDAEGGAQGTGAATLEDQTPHSDLAVSVPISDSTGHLGYVKISNAPDLGAEALGHARRAFALAGAGVGLLAVVVGLIESRGLSAPLRELARVTGRMSDGDLSTRAPVRRRDEIGQLSEQFNRMAARLEVLFAELAAERDALRRFVADASHELRTPITALKNFNELLRGPAAGDHEARDEFLAESAAQIERLEWITHNLLDLSRLDAGLIEMNTADHDLGEVLLSAAGAFRTAARDKGAHLALCLPEQSVAVRCDRARIEMALSNLLDNALKFTPPGGQVEAGVERTSEGARLWVRDTGPGIDPADLPHVFERFYRGRDAPAPGNGLGLAIVRKLPRQPGWEQSRTSQRSL